MYNDLILRLFSNPLNKGCLVNPGATGAVGAPGEGPYMTIDLQVDGDRIRDIRFETYTCPAAIACGSWLTEWANGKTRAEALIMQPEDLSRVLGDLP